MLYETKTRCHALRILANQLIPFLHQKSTLLKNRIGAMSDLKKEVLAYLSFGHNPFLK
jgi:hypothetical protein